MSSSFIRTDKVTRVEVIGDGGREWNHWGLRNVQVYLQDDGRTLKVFVEGNGDQESAAARMFRSGRGGKFTSDQKVKVKDGEV